MQAIVTTVTVSALFTLAASPAFGAPRLRSVQSAGSGCYAGSVDAELRGNVVELTMDPLQNEGGRGANFASARSNCSLILSISSPRQQVAVEAIDLEYSSDLGRTGSSTFASFVYVQGGGTNYAFDDLSIDGQNSEGEATVGAWDDQLAWTPCGGGRALGFSLANTFDRGRTLSDYGTTSVTPKAFRLRVRSCR